MVVQGFTMITQINDNMEVLSPYDPSCTAGHKS